MALGKRKRDFEMRPHYMVPVVKNLSPAHGFWCKARVVRGVLS